PSFPIPAPMNLPDSHDYDPDDNFAQSFHAGEKVDEEAALEALVCLGLLLVNPDDEDSAAQERAAWQALHAAGDKAGLPDALLEVTDWKAGFRVAVGDTAGLVEVIDELAARWNLAIDWGVEDSTDAASLDALAPEDLAATAFDRLREHGYTLWLTDAGFDGLAGWIALRRDDEAMRILASALEIDLRLAGG